MAVTNAERQAKFRSENLERVRRQDRDRKRIKAKRERTGDLPFTPREALDLDNMETE